MVFEYIAEKIVSALGLTGSLADSVEFFIYDSLKITIILSLVIFGVGFLRTYIPPEKVRDYLSGKHSFFGYVIAAVLGIISPFCSCSTIPLFLGFVGAGVPFGMTITFLFVSPMVNEGAIFVFLGVLGWKITLLYMIAGVTLGIVGGYTLNKLGFSKYVIDFQSGEQCYCEEDISIKERLRRSYDESSRIIKSVLPYVFIGIAIGAGVHGYVPQSAVVKYLTGPLAVPGAVIVGIPIYSSIMGVIPVIESLMMKGLPVGTALAFAMSVAALSLPQFIMLKRVMKKELIIAYALMIGTGIILLGLLFNLLI